MEPDNVIYIGRKPVMSYCMAIMATMRGGNSEVILKARGRAISKAVDVAEVVRNQYLTNLKVKEISIGTEQVESEEGGQRNISNMSIALVEE